MEKKLSDVEFLFKNVLMNKLNLKGNYLDIPDNNCFHLCISEVINNLSRNLDKINNDYSNVLIKNFYNYLLIDPILKKYNSAVYSSLLFKLREYMDSNKISKKELYSFLLNVKNRNSLNYYKLLYSEVENIIKEDNIRDLQYCVKMFNLYINEIIARGTDIRFLNFSLSEFDNNELFKTFSNYVKYIGQVSPLNNDVLDIFLPVKLDNGKEIFLEICDKRNQKYEILNGIVYCKVYDCYTNDFFGLIDEQILRISSIFDLIKLYSYSIPTFDESSNILIKSKILDKEFEIPFYYINKYIGNKPYAKHLYNTMNSLDMTKENDINFYHRVLNSLSYAEKDLNYKNSNAFVDTWIALETICSISEIKSGYEAVQYYVPKIITTTIMRQNITNTLIRSYRNYFKDIKLEQYLDEIEKKDYLEFLGKIPNIYNRYVLLEWANILKSPKKLYQYIYKLQDRLFIDILRIYILRNEYVHACNMNAFQTLEFYKLKNIFNIVIDEFFRCLTYRKDKNESKFGIGFDIFAQFNYKWEIMIKSLKLIFEKDKHSYKSDTIKMDNDNVDIYIEFADITYQDYLLNLLKNNNEILKKYVYRETNETETNETFCD